MVRTLKELAETGEILSTSPQAPERFMGNLIVDLCAHIGALYEKVQDESEAHGPTIEQVEDVKQRLLK